VARPILLHSDIRLCRHRDLLRLADHPVVLTTANGLLQILAPPDMRGRVLSIFLMISFGAQPIAALLIGVAADAFTPMGAVLLNGALMIAAAGALVGLRSGLLSWEARQTMTGAAAGPPSR